MGSQKTNQLTTAEAKARLHQAVEKIGLTAWIKHRPSEALAASFGIGLLLGSSQPLRSTMLRMLLRIL